MLEERHYAFTCAAHGAYAVVRAEGELDIAALPALRASILEARARSPRVVLDLRSTTFMDTFVLRGIVALQHQARVSGTWSLHAVSGEGIQRVLDIAHARGRLRWISPEQLAV